MTAKEFGVFLHGSYVFAQQTNNVSTDQDCFGNSAAISGRTRFQKCCNEQLFKRNNTWWLMWRVNEFLLLVRIPTVYKLVIIPTN